MLVDLLEREQIEHVFSVADTQTRYVQPNIPVSGRLRHSSTMVIPATMIDQVIPLSDGCMAYQQVAQGDVRGRVVLVP